MKTTFTQVAGKEWQINLSKCSYRRN